MSAISTALPDILISARERRRLDFNYEFLIYVILGAALAFFFLLYFNRVFASIVSYAIRTWSWHKHRVWIDIGALQISLLGGRIFFTGLRYHGVNETFLVQHGYVTWRYWFRRVREVDIIADLPAESAASSKEKNAKLPCRVNVNLIGVEWFVYNRSPAYDSVLAGLSESHDAQPETESHSSGVFDSGEKRPTSLRSRKSSRNARHDDDQSTRRASVAPNLGGPATKERFEDSSEEQAAPSTRSGSFVEDEGVIRKRSDLPLLVQFFPIHVDCQKAAIVVGNDNTKGILTIKADTAGADIDAADAPTVDPYRQVFKVQFEHPVVELKENEDYKSDQAARATGEQIPTQNATEINIFQRLYRSVLSLIRKLLPHRRPSNPISLDEGSRPGGPGSRIPGDGQWQGLTRYLDDDEQDDKARWASIEYAAESTLLDCPSGSLTIYWDVVSKVTSKERRRQSVDFHTDVNGSEAPAWAMHFSISGGSVQYGPWADRRRADLQRVFFPSLCKDACPSKPLPVGAMRTPTKFKVLIDIDETVTVRVPFREQSKNWRWRGQEARVKQPKSRTGRRHRGRSAKDTKGEAGPERPSAWLEAKVFSNSTVVYEMDMLASTVGYGNSLNIDLSGSELRSVVNQGILWKSGAQRVTCDLPSPLSWNAHRQWKFDIDSNNLELYLLRDHIFLLIDLVDDWTSGPPSDYLTFVPFTYLLNLRLHDVNIYLNVNEANIIDKPTALDENAYLVLSSPLLRAETSIPMDVYRPDENAIPFDIRTDTIDVSFNSPLWNTQSAFTHSGEIGRVHQLFVGGAYHYHNTTSPANTDTLVINLTGDSPHAYLYGVLVRYLILLKDNYFGDYVHFRTLDEYQQQLRLKEQNPDDESTPRPPPKKSNDLDVILSIKATDIRALVPSNLYSTKRCLQGELSSLSLDLRFTNYYMDLDLELSPLHLSMCDTDSAMETPTSMESNTQLYVDGVHLYGNRLFGLPPTEPTYLCNWDGSVGKVSGDCTAEFIALVARTAASFGFTFDDVENALVPYSALVFDDITFARIAVKSIHIWLHVEEAAFLLSTDKIELESNDWARSHYSRKANINVPNIQFSCVDADSAARHKSHPDRPVQTEAYLHTDIHLALIGRKLHFSQKRKTQQEVVRKGDQRTNRTPFLILDEYLDPFVPDPIDPPAQGVPIPPQPLIEIEGDEQSSRRDAASRRSVYSGRQSSFLSSSSSASSIRRSRSRLGPSSALRSPSHRQSVSPGGYPASTLSMDHASPSIGRHASFHSAQSGNYVKENPHSSLAFFSQYHEPHFPLTGVQPDTREAPFHDHEGDIDDEGDFLSGCNAQLDDIYPNQFSEEHGYSSVLVEFTSDITAFINPAAIKHTMTLVSALQPAQPEDILDSLQTSAMSDIFSTKKDREARGSVSDLMLRLPRANIRILNSACVDSTEPYQGEKDQYDFSISRLGLVTRTTSSSAGPSTAEKMNPKTSLYLQLGSAEISASERISSLQKPQAAMMLQVDNIVVSLGDKEVRYFDADVGSVVGSTASGKIEYFASLIHRTASLVEDLGQLVEQTAERHKRRLRFFAHRLLAEGPSVPDPSFLIRPSAVLRSAPGHLRTFDSWKLIMRLRQIWSTMGRAAKHDFLEDCFKDFPPVPPDAAELVYTAFQRWRSWDLEDVKGSALMKHIFGPAYETVATESDEEHMLGACRLSEVQFVLDPGPKENKIGVIDVAMRFDKRIPDADGSHAETVPYENGPLTVLNVCCTESTVNVNWDLCELVDDVLGLYNRRREETARLTASAKNTVTPTKPKSPNNFHIVVELMKGSIDVETVNLKGKTLSRGLKFSALVHNTNGSPDFSSMIFHCDAVTSDLQSYGRTLGVIQLVDPSVFVSQEVQDSRDTSIRTVKATGSCANLKFMIREDPISLMEILDLVLRDEVTQILRLVENLPASQHHPKQPVEDTDHPSTFRLNVAIFLDRYTLSAPVLQSLTYKISGNVARASCSADVGKGIIVDFDVKENSHEMQIDVRNEPRSISLLQIPPTNGRISSQMQQSEHQLTVLSSVEMIQLDASAVYSLLGALNRPQISSALKEMQEQSKVVQKHMTDIFGTGEADEATAPEQMAESGQLERPEKKKDTGKKTLVYNVHLTLAGLQVSAVTPLASTMEPMSQVMFLIDKMYLQASNRHDALAPISEYPEVHVNVKQIGLDIRRGTRNSMRSCGRIGAGVTVSAGMRHGGDGKQDWAFDFKSPDLDISLSPETISTALVVLAYLRGKIKDLDTSRELGYLRKLTRTKPRITVEGVDMTSEESDILDSVLSTLVYHFELQNIRASWNVASDGDDQTSSKEDLSLSIKSIQFGTRTKKSARLSIEDFQLQTVPTGQDKTMRSLHSALLPEVIFNIAYISTPNARRMAFQAVGQSLDLRLTSGFIVPVANLVDSISLSLKNIQEASKEWIISKETTKKTEGVSAPERPWNLFGKKRLESLLIDADFAGSVVQVSSKRNFSDISRTSKFSRPSLAGKYGQFNADDTGSGAVLKSPGLAWKFEFSDNGHDDPTLSGEIKIDASRNILYPSVVPLVLDIAASVQEVVRDDTTKSPDENEDGEATPQDQQAETPSREKSVADENILTADPTAVLGRTRLNLALRVCRQEFTLSCQPIARVATTACFEGIYVTANTVSSADHGNFFAISGTFTDLRASVQHVYSRESTGSFEIDTVTLSLMNSKHVSGTSGVSAILNISPMKMSVNAKQLQDFLLFREIWYPAEVRNRDAAPVARPTPESSNLSQGHLVQRYQQVAATAAFPWTATISIAALDVAVDLGQAIGKSVFQISDFWVSSKKTSDWEQNLCLGFQKIGVDCTGRLSGFVALQDFKLRTSIHWPQRERALNETPLIQASLGFKALRLKAAFDYQAFLVADIRTLEFLMYNVRDGSAGKGDRLVAICDSEAVQAFGTTASASQGVALYRAVMKLSQERKESFQSSLKEIEKFTTRRRQTSSRFSSQVSGLSKTSEDETGQQRQLAASKSPISLDTDVVVTLKALNLGVFPSSFADQQVFKIEALNAYARFAAGMQTRRVHSILKMTLGQLRIGLASVRDTEAPKTLSETSVEDVVQRATGSRGGTILKVPRFSAVMETWQAPNTYTIDYIFKSAFEGKVEVGWNYSRISYIRGMWAKHSQLLEKTWGRELPMAAVKITGVPEGEGEDGEQQQQQKITAEVTVPQSKYNYLALEPPVIETPQLRDMGEATPPLEWIGLHRDRLPNLTHQIVIVSLMELVGEVEDAYAKILGASM